MLPRLMRFDVLPLPLWFDCCCSLTCWTFLDMLVCAWRFDVLVDFLMFDDMRVELICCGSIR